MKYLKLFESFNDNEELKALDNPGGLRDEVFDVLSDDHGLDIG